MEVGGRWDEEAYLFLLELAKEKAMETTPTLRGSAVWSWLRRWVAVVSKAAMDGLASTLVHDTAEQTELWNAPQPALGAVLCAAAEPPDCSRLGLR